MDGTSLRLVEEFDIESTVGIWDIDRSGDEDAEPVLDLDGLLSRALGIHSAVKVP